MSIRQLLSPVGQTWHLGQLRSVSESYLRTRMIEDMRREWEGMRRAQMDLQTRMEEMRDASDLFAAGNEPPKLN